MKSIADQTSDPGRFLGRSLLLVTLLTGVLTVGCSRSDDPTPAVAGPERYCALAQKLDQNPGPPTKEQLAEVEAAAPDEIKADVHAFIVDQSREAEGRLSTWEKTHCP